MFQHWTHIKYRFEALIGKHFSYKWRQLTSQRLLLSYPPNSRISAPCRHHMNTQGHAQHHYDSAEEIVFFLLPPTVRYAASKWIPSILILLDTNLKSCIFTAIVTVHSLLSHTAMFMVICHGYCPTGSSHSRLPCHRATVRCYMRRHHCIIIIIILLHLVSVSNKLNFSICGTGPTGPLDLRPLSRLRHNRGCIRTLVPGVSDGFSVTSWHLITS